VHEAGVVHRDLTPDNIFLRRGDLIAGSARSSMPTVVLIDFGIARQELMSRITLDGSIAGKPHYMSPEQCRGLTVDARSDLYTLGVMLYLMAAGRLPFMGRDPFEVMRAHMTDPPPRLTGQFDQRYADLCEHLLQKAADDRPQSAAAVAHELEQILVSVGASTSINVVSFPARRVSL
jgi:serine/threonine protein kinase